MSAPVGCACGCGEAVRSGRRFRHGHNGRRSFRDRFWEKVDRTEGCWLWSGSLTAAGYGHMRVEGDTFDYSHRIAYTLTVAPIPEGMVIDHLCRNRACCNPEHLEVVTHQTNVARGLVPYGLRTTCKHGHDVSDPANVYTAPDGHHRCRVCANSNEARRAKGRVA